MIFKIDFYFFFPKYYITKKKNKNRDKTLMTNNETTNKSQTLLKDRIKRPSMYEVILLNDDYTPMEFVVDVLMKYFSKDMNQANEVMMHVHRNGTGLCGIYPFDIAETKVMQVMNYSIKNGHPLQCKMEKNK